MKDIPIASQKEYLIKLYDATSKFFNRLRWKLFFCNNEDFSPRESKEEDVFKSNRSAPACDAIKNIKFFTYKSNFQRKLKQDLNKLLIKNKIILFADKTRNLYKTSSKFYNKQLIDNLRKTFKISNENLINKINSESEKIIHERKYLNSLMQTHL